MPLWTFVCTGCSGVHREFSHRVLSVTLHTFTKEQIGLLEAGGNKAARERYLATWDSRDFPLPEEGQTEKIREFMRLKYTDGRWEARTCAAGRRNWRNQ